MNESNQFMSLKKMLYATSSVSTISDTIVDIEFTMTHLRQQDKMTEVKKQHYTLFINIFKSVLKVANNHNIDKVKILLTKNDPFAGGLVYSNNTEDFLGITIKDVNRNIDFPVTFFIKDGTFKEDNC